MIRTANAAASTVLRVAVDQLLGKPLMVFVDSAEHGSLRRQIAEAVRGFEDFRTVVTLQPLHGQPVHAELETLTQQLVVPSSSE